MLTTSLTKHLLSIHLKVIMALKIASSQIAIVRYFACLQSFFLRLVSSFFPSTKRNTLKTTQSIPRNSYRLIYIGMFDAFRNTDVLFLKMRNLFVFANNPFYEFNKRIIRRRRKQIIISEKKMKVW